MQFILKPNITRLKQQGDINGLIKALKFKRDASVRKNAAIALGEMANPEAVEALIQAIKDEDYGTRRSAIVALGKIGDKKAIEPLLEIFGVVGNPITEVDQALGAIGKPAVQPMIRLLRDGDWFIRWHAAIVLGKIKDREALEPLKKALKDESEEVRGGAVEAIAQIIGNQEAEILIESLADESNHVQFKVEDYLAQLNTITPYAGALLEVAKKGDRVRLSVRRLLEKVILKDKTELEPFIRGLQSDDENVRMIAIEVIERSLSGEARNTILEILHENIQPLIDTLRANSCSAARILGEMRVTGAVEALIQVLRENPPGTARVVVNECAFGAIEALAKIKDKRAVEPILDFLFALDPSGISFYQSELSPHMDVVQHIEDDLSLYVTHYEFLQDFTGHPLADLFEDYTELILKAIFMEWSQKCYPGWNVYEYDLEKSDRAVLQLCAIKTAISSNLLHKITEKSDLTVYTVDSKDGSYERKSSVSFEQQRKAAKEELERRGNPPYDPSAYLVERNWKLTF